MTTKAKRIYVFQCEKHDANEGETDGYFIYDPYWSGGSIKGPKLQTMHPDCPHEMCSGRGNFVGVYVPEGKARK